MPLLFFTDHNIPELPFSDMGEIFAFVVLFGLGLWAACRVILGSWSRAALLAVVVMFPVYYYADLSELMVDLVPGGLDPQLACYLLIILILTAGYLSVRRLSTKAVQRTAHYLALVAVITALVTGFSVVKQVSKAAEVDVSVKNQDFLKSRESLVKGAQPDIYYLILDRYEGQISLRERYSFNNQPFVNRLRKRGFYVADASFSNYPITASSLASSLNAGELEATGPVTEVNTRKPLHRLVERPAVVEFLKQRGYRFNLLGSWWGPTQRSELADYNPQFAWNINLLGQRFHARNATGHFLTGTIFAGLIERLTGSQFTADAAHGQIFLEQTRELERISREKARPKFVFAHMLMPHKPYIFDSDGDTNLPQGLSTAELSVRQLQFTSRRMEQVVDTIIKSNRDNPPIIIMTADEGIYPPNFAPTATDAEIRQKTNILASFYFPDRNYRALYPTITPVNTFRVVFNQYFGLNLPLQPDRIRTYPVDRPLEWIDVTERVRQ